MATWYYATAGLNTIEAVEVGDVTDKFVFVKKYNGKKALTSDGQWFRPTREEAKAELIKYRQEKIIRVERNLEFEKAQLDFVKKL